MSALPKRGDQGLLLLAVHAPDLLGSLRPNPTFQLPDGPVARWRPFRGQKQWILLRTERISDENRARMHGAMSTRMLGDSLLSRAGRCHCEGETWSSEFDFGPGLGRGRFGCEAAMRSCLLAFAADESHRIPQRRRRPLQSLARRFDLDFVRLLGSALEVSFSEKTTNASIWSIGSKAEKSAKEPEILVSWRL